MTTFRTFDDSDPEVTLAATPDGGYERGRLLVGPGGVVTFVSFDMLATFEVRNGIYTVPPNTVFFEQAPSSSGY